MVVVYVVFHIYIFKGASWQAVKDGVKSTA
jgi:hypothetical protein